jgi:hypothetical protein
MFSGRLKARSTATILWVRRKFMEGEIFSRDKAGGLDVSIEPVVLI